MNQLVDRFSLNEEKFMTSKTIQKLKEKGDLIYIFKNKLDKACFSHDAVYADSKDLVKITISDKGLQDKTFKIALNSKPIEYQRGLSSESFSFLI